MLEFEFDILLSIILLSVILLSIILLSAILFIFEFIEPEFIFEFIEPEFIFEFIEPEFIFEFIIFEFIIFEFILFILLTLTLVFVPGSQAIPNAPKIKTAERAKVFFIIFSILLSSSKIKFIFANCFFKQPCSKHFFKEHWSI